MVHFVYVAPNTCLKVSVVVLPSGKISAGAHGNGRAKHARFFPVTVIFRKIANVLFKVLHFLQFVMINSLIFTPKN